MYNIIMPIDVGRVIRFWTNEHLNNSYIILIF